MSQSRRPLSDEVEARQRVVEIARSFLGTKYHHLGRVKGVGVDCATLLAEVYEEAGLIPHVELPYYSPQWHLHRDAERYLSFVTEYASEVPGPPLPGDVVLWRFGRTFSHGAIVIEWPMIIHAYLNQSVVLENADAAQWLKIIGETADCGKPRPRKFMSYWA